MDDPKFIRYMNNEIHTIYGVIPKLYGIQLIPNMYCS